MYKHAQIGKGTQVCECECVCVCGQWAAPAPLININALFI